MRRSQLVCLLLVWQLILPVPLQAHANEAGSPAPADLDLSSTGRSIAAGDTPDFKPTQIVTGDVARTITSSELLTPAEHVALLQVLTTGQQSLQLGPLGNAIGGTFALPAQLAQSAGNLVVPPGVTAIHDFASTAVNLAGNLTNSGTFFAVSSSPQVNTAVLSAANIINQSGAVLSSVLPAQVLPGMATAVTALNLSLIAVGDIINSGVISSAGDLNLTAGGTIVNALPAGMVGTAPVMQAVNNLNLTAASIVNQGVLASQLASVNVSTAALTNMGAIEAFSGSVAVQNALASTLSVDNALGAIRARDKVFFQTTGTLLDEQGEELTKAAIHMSGGVLSAPEVAFFSPDGLIDVHADRIDGGVAVHGGLANIGSRTGDLRIDVMNLTGDPIYYAQGGNLDLSGLFSGGPNFLTGGGDFIALATGNITAATAPSGATIHATETSGAGGKIHLASGVTFTVSGGASPISCTSCSGSYSITGTSATGGNILLPAVGLRTNSNSITVDARAGSTAAGSISLGNVESSGAGGACCSSGAGFAGSSAGSITITGASDVQTGFLRAYGGGGGGAHNGVVTGGGAGGHGGTVVVSSSSGSLSILGDVNTSGGGGGSATLGATGGSGGNAGAVNLSAAGTLSVIGPVLAAGGSGGASDIGGRVGGASFGGGGGGGGGGGSGFYGGGGGNGNVSPYFGGGGGGIFGGGAAGSGGGAGDLGFGGTGASLPSGLVFGQGGSGTTVGMSGSGAGGGSAGSHGNVTLAGSTVSVTGTVGSQFSGLTSRSPNPFSTSPFAGTAIMGANVTISASDSLQAIPVSVSGNITATAGNIVTLNATRSEIGLNVHGSSGTVRITAPQGALALSSMNIAAAGKNVFVAAAGDITLPASPAWSGGGGQLALLSGGTIDAPSMSSGTTFSSTLSSGSGGALTVAAGVTYSLGAGAFSITGTSSTGGDVELPLLSLRTNSAPVQIEARSGAAGAGAISIGNLETSGAGGACCVLGNGVNGSGAGSISVSGAGSVAVGFLRAYGGGGSGSGVSSANGIGGAGGGGGSVSVLSTTGDIAVGGDINTSGGGGGSGYIAGGAGGAAGSVTISAPSGIISLGGPVLAAGGQGGAGGNSRQGGASFGGGGGATFGGQGGGGFYGGGGAGTLCAGCSGGGGGIFGGGSASSGGLPGVLGKGGTGGFGAGFPAYFGQNQGVVGTNGVTDVNPGGAAGAGGTVVVGGRAVAVHESIQTYYAALSTDSPNPFASSVFAGHSINAAGPGGSVTINESPLVEASVVYFSDSNLASASQSVVADMGVARNFVVGANPQSGGSGALGTLSAPSVSINGTSSGTTSSGSFAVGGKATITVGGAPKQVLSGDLLTPAEWIAAIQAANGTQTLTLDSSGRATAGSFTIAEENVPWGGFESLLVPSGVNSGVTAAALPVTGSVSVFGTLAFMADGTLSASSLEVGGTLQSTAGSLTINTGSVANNGVISAAGNITLHSFNAPLVLSGTPAAPIASTGNGVIFLVASGFKPIDFNSSWTYDAGATGAVAFSGGALTFADGTVQSVTGGSFLAIEADSLNLGPNSQIIASKATGNAIEIFRYYEPMAINLPGGSSASISTGGGAINLFAEAVTIASGGQPSTLSLGASAALKAQNGNFTVDAGVSVSSSGNLMVQVHGGSSLVNNGAIVSSAAGGAISITGNHRLTLAGSGGSVSVTGGGQATISVIGFDSGLELASSWQFNAGADGLVHMGASAEDFTIADGKSLAVTGGSELKVVARTLTLGDGSAIQSSRANGTAITILSPYTPLTVAGTDGATATISTQGGAIEISPLGGGKALTFGELGAAAVLNFDGGPVTARVVVGSVIVNNGTTVATDNTLTIYTDGYNSMVTNDGSVSAVMGLEVISPYDLTLAGSGSMATANGNVNIVSGAHLLSITHNIQAIEGNLFIKNTDSTNGSIFFGSGSFMKAFTASKESGFGHVSVVIGSGPATKVNTDNPDAVNIAVTATGGGQAFFGGNGIAATGSNNQIHAIGTDVAFDTGGRPAGAITLGGGVIMIADPPLGVGATYGFPDFAGTGRAGGSVGAEAPAPSSPTPVEVACSPELEPVDFRHLVPFYRSDDEPVLLKRLSPQYQEAYPGRHRGRERAGMSVTNDHVRSEDRLVPITFVSGVRHSRGGRVRTIPVGAAGSLVRLAGGCVAVPRQESALKLVNGELLISAKEAVSVHCGETTVVCGAGALALIAREADVVRVRGLHDARGRSIFVSDGHRRVDVSCGQEVILGPAGVLDGTSLRDSGTGRRRIRRALLGSGRELIRSEIPLVTLLKQDGLLAALRRSPESKDREIAERVLKTAACLVTVSSSRGAYVER